METSSRAVETRTFPEFDRFRVQIDHFCAVVQGRESAWFPLEDARCNASVLAALKASAES